MNYTILIIVGIAGFLLGKYMSEKNSIKKGNIENMSENKREDMLEKSKEALSERLDNRLDKILEFMKREELHQKQLLGCDLEAPIDGVTCNQIESLLDVSESTALKYLNGLENEGKVKQIGKGLKTTYILIK